MVVYLRGNSHTSDTLGISNDISSCRSVNVSDSGVGRLFTHYFSVLSLAVVLCTSLHSIGHLVFSFVASLPTCSS